MFDWAQVRASVALLKTCYQLKLESLESLSSSKFYQNSFYFGFKTLLIVSIECNFINKRFHKSDITTASLIFFTVLLLQLAYLMLP